MRQIESRRELSQMKTAVSWDAWRGSEVKEENNGGGQWNLKQQEKTHRLRHTGLRNSF